jgi:hypothetical protein
MSKIEDGNMKAAIRIITSSDSPAANNAQTFQSLCDRHPQAPADRISSPDPSKFPAAQFCEKDIIVLYFILHKPIQNYNARQINDAVIGRCQEHTG